MLTPGKSAHLQMMFLALTNVQLVCRFSGDMLDYEGGPTALQLLGNCDLPVSLSGTREKPISLHEHGDLVPGKQAEELADGLGWNLGPPPAGGRIFCHLFPDAGCVPTRHADVLDLLAELGGNLVRIFDLEGAPGLDDDDGSIFEDEELAEHTPWEECYMPASGKPIDDDEMDWQYDDPHVLDYPMNG